MIRFLSTRWNLRCFTILAGQSIMFVHGQSEDVRILRNDRNPHEGKAPITERIVFAGENHEFRCLVSGRVKENLAKVVLDIHRVVGPTAIPLGEKEISFDARMGKEAPLLELVGAFEVPKSDNPSSYLVRLWNESEGKRALIASLLANAIPKDHFPGLNGRRIQAIGFDPASREPWAPAFSRSGASIEWLDSLPSSFNSADWILVRMRPDSNKVKASALRPEQVVAYFDDSKETKDSPPVDRVEEFPGKGRIITLPMNILTDSANDATSRMRLFRLLTEAAP